VPDNRFKFRAWDGEYMMDNLDSVNLEMLHRGVFTDDDETFYKVIIMQSTGLTDKNGVKIFEGDIIEYDIPLEDEQYLCRNVVEWSKHWGQWRLSRYSAPYYQGYRMEVIGNIHANGDLLNGE